MNYKVYCYQYCLRKYNSWSVKFFEFRKIIWSYMLNGTFDMVLLYLNIVCLI